MPLELVRLDRDRRVPVGADAVALAALAEVHGAILVAQDRVLDLDRSRPASSGSGSVHAKRCCIGCIATSGRPSARMNSGAQRPRQTSAVERADRALVGLDRAHAAAGHVDAGRARAADERARRAPRRASCSAWQMLAPLAMPSLGTCSAPCRRSRSSSGMWRDRLVRGDDVALEPPRGGVGVAAPQLGRGARAWSPPRASRPPTRCAAPACRASGRARASTARACTRASSRWSGSRARARGTTSRRCRRSGPGRRRRRRARRRA